MHNKSNIELLKWIEQVVRSCRCTMRAVIRCLCAIFTASQTNFRPTACESITKNEPKLVGIVLIRAAAAWRFLLCILSSENLERNRAIALHTLAISSICLRWLECAWGPCSICSERVHLRSALNAPDCLSCARIPRCSTEVKSEWMLFHMCICVEDNSEQRNEWKNRARARE